MKISKVAQLCKAERDINLINVEDEDEKTMQQWVGTKQAIYPLHGLRTMDKNQLYTIFDITEKQADKIKYTETTADKIAFRLNSHDFTEKGIQPLHVGIAVGGSLYVPFDTSKGMRLVDRAYLMAMTKEVELLSYCERQTADGKIYIVAQMGMLIVGMIAPRFNAGGDSDLQKFTSYFAARMDYAQMIANAKKHAEDRRDEEEQLTLIHDDETGELLEDAPVEDAPDTKEDQSPAAVASFSAAQAEKTDKIVLKLREDNDGGDAA